MRVLIVDDCADVRTCLSLAFSREGFEVDEASDGPTGLSRALANEYDLLVTDYNMPPTFNGLSLIRKLRLEKPELPVLLVTGNITVNAGMINREDRQVTVLYKPVETMHLLQEANRMLSAFANKT